ncbi:EAL domain-containing protein [Deinococcus aquiradiocola]|uniref:Uncharacterized protein n=1 Tax=Deinococcus aquiradiocola TaxID=393059 RepID=A0A917PGY8_9DEIO|nr:EAL domain-containing protein [Deinococcus aquiradiocola]GGJ78102.1 hypothetical protein GCM10008939_22600 [Deinococcus aquiradiocola]
MSITALSSFLRLRSRSLRQQALLLILAIVIPTFLLQVVLVPDLLLRRFASLEQRQLSLMKAALGRDYDREEARLQAFTQNFSTWSDTYRFAEGRNPSYLSSALVPSTFAGGHVSVWGVTDRAGLLLSSATYGPAGIVADVAGQQLVRTLLGTLPSGPVRPVSGVVQVGEKFYLLAARPITRDDGSGFAGRFLFARLLTPAALAEITSLGPDSQVTLGGPSRGPVPVQRAQAALTFPLSAPDGRTSALLHVTIERPLQEAGRQVTFQLLFITALSAVIALLLGTTFVRRRVLQVVERYDAGIRRMQREPTYRLQVHAQDELGRLAGTVNDLSDRQHRQYLEIQSLHLRDGLTGLLNRTGLTRAAEEGAAVSAVMVQVANLDGMGAVYGAAWADRLVVELAARLREEIPDVLCARLRSDTFALLGTRLLGEFGAVQAAVARPYSMNTGAVQVRLIWGQAEAEAPSTAEHLLSCAELALQEARDAGVVYRQYTQETRERLERRRILEEGLRTMTDETFALQYQPVVDMNGQVPVSFEALLRWTHPLLGAVSPVEFIPLAERGGYIYALGQWVLRRAIRDLLRADRPGLKVNVNVSPLQLLNPAFAEDTLALVRSAGLPTECLVLEVTESAVLEDVGLATAHLTALRAAGVQVALDDFGTGYSSLSLLSRLPIDVIKFDRAFLSEALTERAARTVLTQSVAMAMQLGLPVVAEGIENLDTLLLLRDLGVRFGQGYLFGRPAPFEASLGRAGDNA